MKYMLMMQCTRSQFETLGSWPPADLKAHIEFMIAFAEELTHSGELVIAEGLDIPHNAKLVRAHVPTAPIVSDGPFAESKEFLAGFWIVDVATPQRAIEIAAQASSAPGPGGLPLAIPIELRQVGSAPEL